MAVYLHEEDLPEGVLGPGAVAVDTETMGLITPRDRLCLVQISDGGGDEHLVRFSPASAYAAPNLKAVLADPARVKLYHFARFDLAAIEHYLGVTAAPVFCTSAKSRTASRPDSRTSGAWRCSKSRIRSACTLAFKGRQLKVLGQ